MKDQNSGKHQPFEYDPTEPKEMIIKHDPLTEKQLHYLESLTIDLGFDIHRRNAHIKSIIFREVKHLDELRKNEASAVIDKFKEWKENRKATEQPASGNQE